MKIVAIAAWVLCIVVTATGSWSWPQDEEVRQYNNFEKTKRLVNAVIDNCWEKKNKPYGSPMFPETVGRVNEPRVVDYLYCIEMDLAQERQRILNRDTDDPTTMEPTVP